MTSEGDDAGRPSGLSRRRLLAGIGGVGAIGMASGIGTGAYLTDRETFPDNVFGAGEVGLTVDGEPTDGTVSLGPFAVNRRRSDDRPTPERFDIEASANPVRVWLATRCPSGDPLEAVLEVDIVVDGDSVTDGYRPLDEAKRLLATGLRIDAGCLAPDDGPIVVKVYPYLPADAPDAVAGEATDLTVRLYAEQCRHVSEADAAGSNPFVGGCGEPDDDCPACVEFGKVNGTDAALAVGDVLPVVDLPPGTSPHEIEITAVETKDGDEAIGAAFVLRAADGTRGPDLCTVEVKGGPDANPYDIDPAAPETGDILLAPPNSSGTPSEISHILLSVCSGDGDDDDGDGDDGSSSECAVCDDGNVSLASLDIRYRGDDDASITVVSAKGNTGGTLFDGTVAPDGEFTLFGSDVIRGGNGNNGNGTGNGNNGNAGTSDKLGPEIDITVDGGSPTSLHVSCSEPLAVGMRFGDGDLFEVTDATTTDGQPICGTEEN
ncbi:DUF7467 domain-containing protein [Halorubrum sp. FL23]|uniref:DUF7467 domain-containing protein n=1 Tax=Halorubrum sp. FL23 TaxID=3458704 RepID=UPI004033F2A3